MLPSAWFSTVAGIGGGVEKGRSVKSAFCPVYAPETARTQSSAQRGVMGSILRIPGLVVLLLLLFAVPASAQLVISEFRVRGPSGANDEFVEIMNNSAASHTVAGGGNGYALAASDGVARCAIPNGTVLPPRGRYLCVNSVAYSLASYPAGNGTTATGDATYTTDIPDNAGIALFSTSVAAELHPGQPAGRGRVDERGEHAVQGGHRLSRPGPLQHRPRVRPRSMRKGGLHHDVRRVPQRRRRPRLEQQRGGLHLRRHQRDVGGGRPAPRSSWAAELLQPPGRRGLDAGRAARPLCRRHESPEHRPRLHIGPSRTTRRSARSNLRARYTNNTGVAVTRLRFRVIDLTTFPAPSGIADLRPRTSSDIVVTVDRAPCGTGTSNVTVHGTTLEQPPSQPNGGGFNSSYSLNDISTATPLANGDGVDVRFLLGIQQTGRYKIGLVVETLPDGVNTLHEFAGCTDAASCPGLGDHEDDGVTTATPGGSVTYTITASNAGPSNVTGATVADTFPASLTCTWTCVGAGGGTCTAAGSGDINDTVNLPVGGSVTYTASCTIAPGATGSLVNTATVSAPAGVTDPNLANNTATDTDTLAGSANLAITKTDGVTTATPGGSVTYTIVASNAGPSAVTGATVADTFPAALTCTWTCVGAGGGTCTAAGSGNINNTVNLPVGGSVTYTASCTIAPGATGSLANTATVSAPAGVTDPNLANNTATDTDTLAGSANLAVTKTASPDPVIAGQNVTYTITVTNSGPSPAASVALSDPLPASATFVSLTSPGGWSCTTPAVGAGGTISCSISRSPPRAAASSR